VQGDNRGFSAVYSLQSAEENYSGVTQRTGTVGTVDTESREFDGGLEPGTYSPLSGFSRDFAEDALYDGHLDPADNDSILHDCHLLEDKVLSPGTENNMQVTRLGKHTIQVHLTGEARDGLFPPIITADIEWDWELTIDNDNAQATTYALVGKQKAFPAHELYINGHFIYQYDVSRFRSSVTIPSPTVYQDPSQPPIPQVVLPDYTLGLLQLINPLINEPTMGPIGSTLDGGNRRLFSVRVTQLVDGDRKPQID
jgi:hypothetical protein